MAAVQWYCAVLTSENLKLQYLMNITKLLIINDYHIYVYTYCIYIYIYIKSPGVARIYKYIYIYIHHDTCCCIPLHKWVLTPVIYGTSRVNPLIAGRTNLSTKLDEL